VKSSHAGFMLVCCLATAAAVGAVILLGLPVHTVVLGAIAILCPVSHWLMMGRREHGAPPVSHPGQARPSGQG
jgi:hypothetical protein